MFKIVKFGFIIACKFRCQITADIFLCFFKLLLASVNKSVNNPFQFFLIYHLCKTFAQFLTAFNGINTGASVCKSVSVLTYCGYAYSSVRKFVVVQLLLDTLFKRICNFSPRNVNMWTIHLSERIIILYRYKNICRISVILNTPFKITVF